MIEILGRQLKRGDLVYFQKDDLASFGIILDKATIFIGYKVDYSGTVVLLNTLDKNFESVKSDLIYKYTLQEQDSLYGEQKPGDVFLVHKTSQGALYDDYWVYLGKAKQLTVDGKEYVYRYLYYKLNFLSSYRELYVNTVERTVNIDLKAGCLVYQNEVVNSFKNYLGNFEFLNFDDFRSNLYNSSGDEMV